MEKKLPSKKIRHFSLLLMFVLCVYQSNAQEDTLGCVTPENSAPDATGTYTYSTNQNAMMNGEPQVLNVYYWQINSPNGNNPSPISENIVLESVALLNITFNPNNIFFKYRGFEAVNSPNNIIQEEFDGGCSVVENNGIPVIDPNGFGTVSRCQLSEFWNFASNNAERNDAINIYVPYLTDDFAGAARTIGTNQILVPTSNSCNSILIHEVGHALGLRHTHSGYSSNSGCERVTRNPNDLTYNATTAGDRVADTAAVPDFIREYCFFDDPTATCNTTTGLSRFYIDETICEYIGDNVDCDDTPYQIFPEDVRNYMSYSDRDCFDYFSPGQGIRMQETIENDTDLIAATTTVEALYEPYKGYYFGDSSQPATAEAAHLQPGFDYFFVRCEGDYPIPSEYDDTTFNSSQVGYTISKYEDDYSIILHNNRYAFSIAQLDNTVRKCYRYGPVAAFMIGGTVTKFNDNVMNQNYTTEEKTSEQMNDEELINNLDPGLYLLNRTYQDGTQEQSVISKNNQ